jgi:starch synthase (maltosyl-transferring)
VIFLSEAFTRPKLMKGLAKLGFTQSYTYFTWRTAKWEIESYLNELTAYPERDYCRPNFFVSTPDILPYHLQSGEAWMFKARARARRERCPAITESITGSNCSSTSRFPGARNISIPKNTRSKPRDWNQARQHQALYRRAQPARESANPALQQTQQSAVPGRQQRTCHWLCESGFERRQHRGRRDFASARCAGFLASAQ